MNQLTAQIDVLDDTVTGTKRTIKRHKQANESGSRTADTLLQDLSTQVTTVTSSLVLKEKEVMAVRDSLAHTFAAIQALRELFTVAEFREIMLFPALQQQGVSSKTVMGYLSEVDAGVTSLCTWLSFLRGSTVSYLQPKAFGSRKQLALRVAMDTDLEEGKDVLTEAEIRTRVRLAFDQRLQSSVPKRHSVTPH